MDIIVQEGYQSNLSLQKILNGILDSTDEAISCHEDTSQINDKIAVVIGAANDWEIATCNDLLNKQIQPIIVMPSNNIETSSLCACICSDCFSAVSEITSLLIPYTKKNIVFAGINPTSSADIIKLNGFKQALLFAKLDYNEENVFYSYDDMLECAKNVVAACDRFDTVICANDTVAILISSLLTNPEKYNITGFGGMLCTKYTHPTITTISVDYYTVGRAAVEAYNIFKKYQLKSSLYVKNRITLGQSTPLLNIDSLPQSRHAVIKSNKKLMIYKDSVFNELDAIELILQKADEVDIKIIEMLVSGVMTQEEIAEEVFLSLSSLKYRIKRLLNLTSINKKNEFVGLLKKYHFFDT